MNVFKLDCLHLLWLLLGITLLINGVDAHLFDILMMFQQESRMLPLCFVMLLADIILGCCYVYRVSVCVDRALLCI